MLVAYLTVGAAPIVTRRVRTTLFLSFLMSLALQAVAAFACLPASVNQREYAGTAQHAQSVTRWGAYAVTAAGGLTSLVVIELGELFYNVNFSISRNVAEQCDIGAPVTMLAAMASSKLCQFVCCGVCCGAVYAAFRYCGFMGIALLAVGSMSHSNIMALMASLGPLSNNVQEIASTTHLSHEVIQVAEALSDRFALAISMSQSFTATTTLLDAILLIAAFALSASSDVTTQMFSSYGVVCMILGGSAMHLISAIVLLGVVHTCNAASKPIERLQRRDQYQRRAMSSTLSEEEELTNETVISKATASTAFPVLAVLLPAVGLPPLIGFVFGFSSVVCFLVGACAATAVVNGTSSTMSSILSAAKSYVLKGGLRDASRFSHHHGAAITAAAMGGPLVPAEGYALCLLLKILCVVAIILAPIMHQVSRIIED